MSMQNNFLKFHTGNCQYVEGDYSELEQLKYTRSKTRNGVTFERHHGGDLQQIPL